MRILIIGNAPGKIAKLKFKYDYIVSLDGAVNRCLKVGIIPDVVIGDMDSIHPNQPVPKIVKFLHLPDQNSTDMEKGIRYADSIHAKEIHIINAFGGPRFDHVIYNARLLKKCAKKTRRIIIFHGASAIEFLNNKKMKLIGKLGFDIALMAFPEAKVTTLGLKYEMKDHKLDFALSESACNKFAEKKVQLDVKGEALLIYPVQCEVII